ncbi:MAG: hypothetical protein ACEPOW_04020 [Bacteroidales bacterium]
MNEQYPDISIKVVDMMEGVEGKVKIRVSTDERPIEADVPQGLKELLVEGDDVVTEIKCPPYITGRRLVPER